MGSPRGRAFTGIFAVLIVLLVAGFTMWRTSPSADLPCPFSNGTEAPDVNLDSLEKFVEVEFDVESLQWATCSLPGKVDWSLFALIKPKDAARVRAAFTQQTASTDPLEFKLPPWAKISDQGPWAKARQIALTRETASESLATLKSPLGTGRLLVTEDGHVILLAQTM